MHVHRQLSGAGAVLAATAAVVLSGSAAQATCSTESTEQWHVGAQLGPTPVQLTGTGGPLGALLYVAPVSQVAVESASGQNLLRLDAASVRTRTESPALPDGLDLVDPVGGVRVLETDRARTPDAGPRAAAVDRPSQTAHQVDSVAGPAREEIPLRAGGADNTLGGPLNWVPIEAFGAFGPDGEGLPWATGIALAVLGAGVAGVTVVARRGRVGA